MKTGTHTKNNSCVEYEQAVLLKKLGFDWYSRQSYVGKEFVDWMGWRNTWSVGDPALGFSAEAKDNWYPMIAAPTLLFVRKWLREVHGIYISTPLKYFRDTDYNQPYYELEGVWFIKEGPEYFTGRRFESFVYEEALDAGLQEALKLIK